MSKPEKHLYEFGPFRLDPAERLLLREDRPVPLTPKAFDTLVVLVEQSGHLVGKDELMRQVWGDNFVEENNLDKSISALRKALGEDSAKYIATVRGAGYRFTGSVHESTAAESVVLQERTRTHILIEDDQESVIEAEPLLMRQRQVGKFRQHRTGILVTLIALAVVVAAFGFGWNKFRARGGAGHTVAALTMVPVSVNGVMGDAALSPDGKYVVYKLTSSDQAYTESLWMKHLPTDSAVQILPPTTNMLFLSNFTADSNYVYYGERNSDTNVMSFNRVSVVGGAKKKLADNINGLLSFAVSPDGKQFASVRIDKGIYTLFVANEDGTGERPLVTMGGIHEWLEGSSAWSPDGKTIVCFTGSTVGGWHHSLLQVNVGDGAQKALGTMKWIGADKASIVWLADGSGLLVSAAESFALPAQVWQVSYPDGATRRVVNDLNDYWVKGMMADSKTFLAIQTNTSKDIWVAPVGGDTVQARQVTFTNGDALGSPAAWAPDGSILISSTAGGKRTLWVADADGNNRRQILSGADDYGAAVSPDGRHAAFTSTRDGMPHIWRVDLDESNLRQLTFGSAEDHHPRWTPDGKWIVFESFRVEGKLTVWKIPAEGGEAVQLSDKSLRLMDLSPDGKLIACYDGATIQPGKTKVFLLPIEGGEPTKTLELPVAFAGYLSWTADGRAITYSVSPHSVDNIWALPLDGGPPKQLTNFHASSGPRYIEHYALARDGKRLAVTRVNVTNSLVLISNFK